MTYLASIGAALVVASGSLSQQFMGGAALIAIIAGIVSAVFTVKTKAERDALRAQIDIERGAADAWKTERDAEVAKADRLSTELRDETRIRTAAEARTDITRVDQQIATNHHDTLALLGGIKQVLDQIAANTLTK